MSASTTRAKRHLSKCQEQTQIEGELDVLDEQLRAEERQESDSPRKPRVQKHFNRMVSYRSGEVFEDEVYQLRMTPKKSKSKDPLKIPYLFCVDPEKRLFYKLNMRTFQPIYQQVEDEDLERILDERITGTLRTIKRICNFAFLNHVQVIVQKAENSTGSIKIKQFTLEAESWLVGESINQKKPIEIP